ncbi:MAG: YggS family pyridoxal phosphate-dependent enzyme [Azoarcus sp.]|nr:YggS family pyridoxal phosphate-dependent enzyme [Azoarcus sp.]
MSPIAANLNAVRARIAAAAQSAGRDPHSIRLLAVSKTWPASDVSAAFEAGQYAFGENYADELGAKAAELAHFPLIEWHFIGALQSNKTRVVAENCAWAHGIGRLKIAERLSAQRPENLPPLQICLQVNVSGEASKSGVPIEEAVPLAHAVAALPRLVLRGLMCIPEPTGDVALLRRRFALLRELNEQLKSAGLAVDTLSMGMSHDLEAAIAEGATIVRVGTAIFGSRPSRAQTDHTEGVVSQ